MNVFCGQTTKNKKQPKKEIGHLWLKYYIHSLRFVVCECRKSKTKQYTHSIVTHKTLLNDSFGLSLTRSQTCSMSMQNGPFKSRPFVLSSHCIAYEMAHSTFQFSSLKNFNFFLIHPAMNWKSRLSCFSLFFSTREWKTVIKKGERELVRWIRIILILKIYETRCENGMDTQCTCMNADRNKKSEMCAMLQPQTTHDANWIN